MTDQNISEIERNRIAPEAFSIPGDRYLGNPDVVAGLVGGFAAKIEAIVLALAEKRVSSDEAKQEMAQLISGMARIFSGKDADYQIIKGWNDESLPGRLIADLSPFWRRQRAEWQDDAVAVLFDWLASLIMEKMRDSQGDDLLFGAKIKPSMQYASAVLLGIDRRAGS